MIVFLIILIALTLFKARFSGKDFYKSDYISRDQTLCINGFFVTEILLSHTFAKFSSAGVLNDSYGFIRIYLGQFVVVPILFFSGYGIMESIKHKPDYIKRFPKQRLLNLYLKFVIITLIYVVINLIYRQYEVWRVLLSFTGIISIGNGGWYIWATLVIYIFTIICFNIFRKNRVLAVATVTALTLGLTVAEMLLDFPTYYYSTMLFMPIGMCFSLVKDTFDRIVMRNNAVWSIMLVLSISASVGFNYLAKRSFVFYPVWCFFGIVALLLVCMKVKLNSKAVKWAGQTAFFIFLLQGIPQLLLQGLSFNDYLYYIAVFALTFVLVAAADIVFRPLDRVLKK